MRKRVWIEISKKNLIHNVKFLKTKLNKDVNFGAVVKSNAYGHGIKEVSTILYKHGVKHFMVNTLEEALLLKEKGIKAFILIMGYIPMQNLEIAVKEGFRFVFYNKKTIKFLKNIYNKNKEKPLIHIKIETGTNRQGVNIKELKDFIKELLNAGIKPEGIYTHFANIEDTTDHSYAYYQLTRFKKAQEMIKASGITPKYVDTACSAAILLFKETHFNLVRAGISLYGLWPSKETYLSYLIKHGKENTNLKPVLTWKTVIAQIKDIEEGECISYGCSYRTTYPSKIAVLPVGYYEGYDRRLSNIGYVLIKGKRAPVKGRVCMNMVMVDVTHIEDVKVGDEVILIGESGKEKITADDMAQLLGTINYEVVTRINNTLPRVIV